MSADVHLQLFAAMLLAELAQGFFLNLTYALAGQAEALADLFERQRVLTANAEVETRDLGFAWVQHAQGALDVDLQRLAHQHLVGCRVFVVREHIEEAVVVVLVERRIHREVAAGVLQGFAYLFNVHFQLSSPLVDSGLAFVDLGEAGARQWLAADAEALRRYDADRAAAEAFRAWSRALREALTTVYGSDASEAHRRLSKAAVFSHYRDCYQMQRAHLGGGRYDRTVAALNNARLALFATYADHRQAFEVLFERSSRRWPEFFGAVDALARLDAWERGLQLAELTASGDEQVAAHGDHGSAGEVQCEPFLGHALDAEAPGREHDDVGRGRHG